MLEQHHRTADHGYNPRHRAVHLVRARHLHRSGGEGVWEEDRRPRTEGFERRPAVDGRGEVSGRAVGREERGCYPRGGEAEEVEADEEEFVQGASDEEDGLRRLLAACSLFYGMRVKWIYLVRVVQVHDPRSAGTDVLMALALTTHAEGGVHVHVVAREVQAN